MASSLPANMPLRMTSTATSTSWTQTPSNQPPRETKEPKVTP